MEVILCKTIKGVGKEGDIIKVKDGYARNYLLPKGLAVEASKGNIKNFQQKKRVVELKEVRQKEEAARLKEALEGLKITIRRKSGEEGKIFGSVTNQDIAEALEKKGFIVDKKRIQLERPLKALGTFQVPVKLLAQIEARLSVEVIPE